MTSHGAHGPGLYLAAHEEFLSPDELDTALSAGCAASPTVAIVSACYSGVFAQPPMARPNRIVLTAAAADRPSFGCGAGAEYAFYDECLIRSLHSLPRDWPEVIADTGSCVAGLEARDKQPASMPQSAVGPAVARLPVPGLTRTSRVSLDGAGDRCQSRPRPCGCTPPPAHSLKGRGRSSVCW